MNKLIVDVNVNDPGETILVMTRENFMYRHQSLWEVITAQISVHHTDESVDKTLILNGQYTDSKVWCTMIYQCC